VLEIVLSIYTPIVIGVLLGAGLSPGERELYFFSRVVLYVFLPALLFTSTYSRVFQATDLRPFALTALSALSVVLTFLLTRSLKEEAEVVLTSMYANAGYLPVGIAQSLWGTEGVASVGFYIFGNNSVSNVLAPTLSSRISSPYSLARRILSLPPIAAVMLGLVLGAVRVTLPSLVIQLLKPFSDAAATIALVQLGVEFCVKPALDPEGLKSYAYRLTVVVPLTLLFVKTGILEGVDKGVAVLESVMPSAASCVPISRELGLDAKRVARIVVTSTLVSTVAVLPLLLVFVPL